MENESRRTPPAGQADSTAPADRELRFRPNQTVRFIPNSIRTVGRSRQIYEVKIEAVGISGWDYKGTVTKVTTEAGDYPIYRLRATVMMLDNECSPLLRTPKEIEAFLAS